jgi:hypothetical protein
MIPQETYHGGAVGVVASTVLTPFSASVILCDSGSAINVDLPDPANMTVRDKGFARFTVINKGAGTVSVRTHSGSAVTTATTGQAVELFLGNTAFHFRKKTVATPRAIGSTTRGSVLNDSGPTTYSTPNCFIGSDCDYADFSGNEPLDGEDGREKCIVPMCQDVVAFCENSTREPIRAADVVMPSVMMIRLSQTDFAADPAHPLAGTVLPAEFYTALFNNAQPHALLYDNKAVGVRSRHPHHLRWEGSPTPAWGHGTGLANLTVTRHTWKKTIAYSSGGTDYEIDMRFVAEHTLSGGNEPGVDPTVTAGGTMNRNYGAWGTMFSLYIFCNQLSPSFVDGDSFTPIDSSGPVSFTKADPFVSGIAYGVGETSADKFCHPQLVVVAHLPTTFQSPMGYSHSVLENRDYIASIFSSEGTIRGRNRLFNHKLRNGSPWIDPGSDPERYPRASVEDADIFGNIVFGWTISTKSSAAMTLGGGFPTSTPTPFLVWENGLGVGRTYLIPNKPGWDELSGQLDVVGGSSGSVTTCNEDSDGLPGENGVAEWPYYEFEECIGHPTEPFEGAGGGHLCFNNANDLDGPVRNCCTETARSAVATVTDKCKVVGAIFGSFSGLGCASGGTSCEISGTRTWHALLDYEDHEYFMNGNQLLRNIMFAKPIPDPSLVFADYTHTGVGSLFAADHGTWSLATATPSGTNVVHASNIKALARYINAPNPVQDDVIVTAEFRSATTVAQALGGRVGVSVGAVSGYFAVIQPTGGTNATVTIRKYVSNVETILATKSITNLTSATVDVEFDVWGCSLVFTWTVSGQSEDSLSVEDATFMSTPGEAAIAVVGSGTGIFADIFINDERKDFIRIEATQGCYANGLSWPATVPAERANNLTECADILTNPECGSCCHTNPSCNPICYHCNCVSLDGTPLYIESFSWTGLTIDDPDGRDVLITDCSGPNSYSGDGENPTYVGGPVPRCDCFGPFCGSGEPKCGTCPDPFVNGEVIFPNCWPESLSEEDQPRMCRGIRNWFYADGGCS